MRHTPRKRFGQNFLQDQTVIHAIVQAIQPQLLDNILEIGPGLGALTMALLPHVQQLTAIELDRDLQAYLSQLPAGADKLTVIAADALTVDYREYGDKLRIIGNLPYNISTPLLLRLVDFASCIDDMYFMLQKEVVERMCAQVGTKAYGRLTVMLQYHCDINYLFTVPPEAFNPIPKVDSAMVQLIPHTLAVYDKVPNDQLASTVAKAFGMRRKTLINNLKGLVTADQLQALGIDGSLRPEQISIKQYVQLAKFIFK